MAPRRIGLWIPVLLVLQACSTTPFGRQLAESFDPPPAPPTATANAQTKQEQPKPEEPNPQDPDPQKRGSVEDTAAATAKPATTAKTQEPAQPPTAKPQPYRITIRLSGADPAAPAELVTRSLREAGIPFEVETIERISPAGGAASGDTPSPAATP
ncbi:hypothetical protein SynRS9909_02200 [Synechococcus sp. RS9909]|uniref:hypothetical protein n=1 Tax=unclassified Synechococcus TaxID=2626047 RepID=UPI000068F5F5|nr:MULTISPECIES: hypothetical protein [unclassified Synechococcus]EAQ69550.1 hypothetical protein RS9917_08951 [Synechococcus sp. RS9917]QNI80180.1 hypothetical protein SynRS9909_02200 [Synechococcus sp. RS9909]